MLLEIIGVRRRRDCTAAIVHIAIGQGTGRFSVFVVHEGQVAEVDDHGAIRRLRNDHLWCANVQVNVELLLLPSLALFDVFEIG